MSNSNNLPSQTEQNEPTHFSVQPEIAENHAPQEDWYEHTLSEEDADVEHYLSTDTDAVPPKPHYGEYLARLAAIEADRRATVAQYQRALRVYNAVKAQDPARFADQGTNMPACRAGDEKRKIRLEQKYVELAFLLKNAEERIKPYYTWHENAPNPQNPHLGGNWVLDQNTPNSLLRARSALKVKLAAHAAKMKAFQYMHPETVWEYEIAKALRENYP
jgi:hypothetical protein